jgi:fumarate reductase flavoprotein subunit
MSVKRHDGAPFAAEVPVAIVGAGAAGLVAALKAKEGGVDPLVIERDPVPRGSTALSAGLIPAAGTRWQQALGIEDSPACFAADIMAKAKGEPDAEIVARVTAAIGPVLEWLADRHRFDFSVIANFRYPGHSALRMHALPSRSGAELIDRLRAAAEAAGVQILSNARASSLIADEAGRAVGVEIKRPDGSTDRLGAQAVILASNGYGGNRSLVSRYICEMADALYFGHPGNQGDALLWGLELGAEARHLSGYQGHGSVASPHGILISWAAMTEGGYLVNLEGRRFIDESLGYSEAAAAVIAQKGRIAFAIFDERVAAIMRQFEDYRTAEALGAVKRARSVVELANSLGVDAAGLSITAAEVDRLKAGIGADTSGRIFGGSLPLAPPYLGVCVTGALFHTQGGLAVNGEARVMSRNQVPLPNIFAAGGAAAGVSGSKAAGYLSGNGLLTAVALGAIAGEAAARLGAQG